MDAVVANAVTRSFKRNAPQRPLQLSDKEAVKIV